MPLSCNGGLVFSPYLDALTCYYNNQQNCRWCFAPSDITALARHSPFFKHVMSDLTQQQH